MDMGIVVSDFANTVSLVPELYAGPLHRGAAPRSSDYPKTQVQADQNY